MNAQKTLGNNPKVTGEYSETFKDAVTSAQQGGVFVVDARGGYTEDELIEILPVAKECAKTTCDMLAELKAEGYAI